MSTFTEDIGKCWQSIFTDEKKLINEFATDSGDSGSF